MPKKRKWSDEYVRYGFTALLDDRGESDRAQCMTCHFIMCNSNLKPARLKEHHAKHPAAEHEQTFQALQTKGLDMTKGVHYLNLDSSQCKTTSTSFLRGGIPVHPSEGCTFYCGKPN